MTKLEKMEIILFYINKHSSNYARGKLYNHLELIPNVTLKELEEAVRTDKYDYNCYPCNKCIRMTTGFCNYAANGKCNNYERWCFRYRYWRNVMKRERKIFQDDLTVDRQVLLKKFGILDINKNVLGHKHANGLWHVLFNGDWHEVPECDIELIEK